MTYTVTHTYVNQVLIPEVTETRDVHHAIHYTVECSASGSFAIGFPGKLHVSASAWYETVFEPDGVHALRGAKHSLQLTIELRTPDGQLFTADEVTLDDLLRFRDLRGASQGKWSYSVEGKIHLNYLGPPIPDVSGLADGGLSIVVDETVTSQSAPPLVSDRPSTLGQHRYTFDLYRVGTFVATAKPDIVVLGGAQPPLMLLDPAGAEVATSQTGTLTFPVSLETLETSRDANGNVRFWSLEVQVLQSGTTVSATVIATSRIRTQTLNSRLFDLLGDSGHNIYVYGDMRENNLLARLEINDPITAGTIDMHQLLGSVLKPEKQDPGVDVLEIKAHVPYVLYSHTRDLPYEMHVSLDGIVQVDTISINVGASDVIQPSIPAVQLVLAVEGDVAIDIGGFPIATVSVNNNQIVLEAGVGLEFGGTLSPQTWINDSPFSIDLSWEAVAALVGAQVISADFLGAISPEILTGAIQSYLNDHIVQGFHDFLFRVMGRVPDVLAMIMGDYFTYRSIGVDGEDIVFEYIAPFEPEPKPSPNYVGVTGRSVFQEAADLWRIRPTSLGDTWSAENLNKIHHIVVVMMENRSFDHMLGYRAQLPGHEDSDGLTDGLITFLQSQIYDGPITDLLKEKPYEVRKLGRPESNIKPNTLGFKTKFPAAVGHFTDDVEKQLEEALTLPSGRAVNSPKGFAEDFASKLAGMPEAARTKILDEIDALDVLGYYEAKDLPFLNFLAENYAYCERYFSSHPGPTLPNRMYSLSGNLQYDRTGGAIVDNNDGDHLALSRAVNIYDLLTRKRIGWRVYESFPSVTMLRMFARYVTDDTNIVRLERLQADVDMGNLPAVTVIDPRMHSAPENDDHSPFADMYEGQRFLEGVYTTLSNSALWESTMLIITYDEHGGFYDHVRPPIAELRTVAAGGTKDRGPFGPAASTASTISALLTDYGLRVPAFVVSPWVPPGKGPDIVLDHCSILKTILARFCPDSKPFLSDRVNASQTFDAYLSESSARMNVPPPPPLAKLPPGASPTPASPSRITTAPITRQKILTEGAEFAELTGMYARLLLGR
jgi:hypothetical protein